MEDSRPLFRYEKLFFSDQSKNNLSLRVSPATRMMNEDVISEILSHCPATEIGKFRLLNKACNKRSYELTFINHHLRRTNSVFGYFVHYEDKWFKYHPSFVSGIEEEEDEEEESRISLEFLPSKNAKIEACDTHNGILLCIDDKFKGAKRIPDYIVCKPATKQYRIIPNPKTRYLTIATGLMVISSTPFRYKIVRVSEPRTWMTKEGFYNHKCEVFDSDSFAWKQLNDFELPEFFPRAAKPVLAYGCLHWLTRQNNVIRFCMRTESWSIFPVPDEVRLDDNILILVSYEGKLGVIHSEPREGADLWVLENNVRKCWVSVKDAKIAALKDNYYAQPVWFPSNDVVSVAGSDRLGLYNMNSNNYRYLQMQKAFFRFGYSPSYYFIPFYSNYDRVGLTKNEVENKI